MHFLRMFKRLKDQEEPGTYAYAVQLHDCLLIRMHVTENCDPVFSYMELGAYCEEEKPRWERITDPTGYDLDCEWSLKIPKACRKPKALMWPEDSEKECRWCGSFNCTDRYCRQWKAYVSGIMGCKKFRECQAPRQRLDVAQILNSNA